MIVIYTVSGMLWSVLAVGAGVAFMYLTGKSSLSLCITAVILIASHFAAKKMGTLPIFKVKPTIFFVPLFVYGVICMLLAGLVLFAEIKKESKPQDLRETYLEEDYKKMKNGSEGEAAKLVGIIKKILSETVVDSTDSGSWSFYAKSNEKAVLVIVQIPKLKNSSKEVREMLLRTIDGCVTSQKEYRGKDVYVVLKGLVLLGAVKTPSEVKLTVANNSDLFPFYANDPVPVPVDQKKI